MSPRLLLLCALFAAACAAPGSPSASPSASTSSEPRPGLVVAVGGGGTPEAVIQHVAALAGGAAARVIVLPQASEVSDGQASAAMWREQGAGTAEVLSELGAADAGEKLRAADVIWMPGGDQSRLMARLAEHGLVDVVREAHAAGAIVGGTSAGAAVLSAVMISGAPEPLALRGGAMEALTGLGLLPWAIVDQHFVERDRLPRLLTAVLDHPALIGIGISERTAALVDGRNVEVMGEGQVLFVDARAATAPAAATGGLQTARSVTLHALSPGERLALP